VNYLIIGLQQGNIQSILLRYSKIKILKILITMTKHTHHKEAAHHHERAAHHHKLAHAHHEKGEHEKAAHHAHIAHGHHEHAEHHSHEAAKKHTAHHDK
jgi:Flp pilus assembly protein TadD